MAIDLTTQKALRPPQAAKLIPPLRRKLGEDGRPEDIPTHPATITRWILKGLRTPDGRLVKLEAARLPSGWVTTADALAEFLAAITPRTVAQEPGPTAAEQRRRAEHADRQLEAAWSRP